VLNLGGITEDAFLTWQTWHVVATLGKKLGNLASQDLAIDLMLVKSQDIQSRASFVGTKLLKKKKIS
jgi:hypothetical protein